MRRSTVKSKLSRDEPAFIVTLHLTDPAVYEMASGLGFDGIWIDLEHHPVSLETVAALMRAARVGSSDLIARPAKGEFMRLGRLLESGAQGIIYPRCSSNVEAAEVVAWSKFAPLGKRGFDGSNPDNRYCELPLPDYIQQANRETFVVIQLEDRHAIAAADQIAAVEGVDALMLGPADFSISEGVPGDFSHASVLDAARRVADAARAAGKHWGMPVFSEEHAHQLLDMGARLLFQGADIVMLRQALEASLRNFDALRLWHQDRSTASAQCER
jgi:4-hydroxy-2-oxoheptanedioate aldolase